MDECAINLQTKLQTWLRALRQSHGLDIGRFSQRTGVTTAQISRMENGLSDMTTQTVVKVCRGFAIHPNLLLAELGFEQMNFDVPQMTLCDAGLCLKRARKANNKVLTEIYGETQILPTILSRMERGRMFGIRYVYLLRLDQCLPGSNILPVFWAVYSNGVRIVDSQQFARS